MRKSSLIKIIRANSKLIKISEIIKEN